MMIILKKRINLAVDQKTNSLHLNLIQATEEDFKIFTSSNSIVSLRITC
jgi:hypothetical protein